MTDLSKPVTRRTAGETVKSRRVIVTMKPPDLVGFRLERTQETFWMCAASGYYRAAGASVETEQKVRRRVRRGLLSE